MTRTREENAADLAREEAEQAAKLGKRFRHDYQIAFSVESGKEDASDVTASALWSALRDRLSGMGVEEMLEAAMLDPDNTEVVD
jgi:hypothetical protein